MSAIWNIARLENQTYPQLRSHIEADVAVIGAGITGLTTALKLAEAGQRVVVLDAFRICDGNTGGSTGNLYATLSGGLAAIRETWSEDVVRQVVALRTHAMDFIEDAVARFSIDCAFARRPLYFCISRPNAHQSERLEAEYEAAKAAGLAVNFAHGVPELPFPVDRALRIEQQAQFNPLCYTLGLANAVTEFGGLIFESSRACAVDAGRGLVTTEHGEIRADHIVQATHTPKGVNLLQAEMEAFREYGVAAEIHGDVGAEGIFWMLNDSRSVRTYSHDGSRYLVVVGEKHKTGLGTLGEAYYTSLKEYARAEFGVTEFEYQWSAQQYKSADLLPYIGRSGHHNVYVGTGFGADGLTWGTVAASIISRQITGREATGADLLDPRRFTPVKSAKNWLKENATVSKNLLKDYLTTEQLQGLEAVAPGEGKIISLYGEKLAVYRSADHLLSVLSPICPHMKCMVHWNAADTTWDCPCHGSRFAADGAVIEGPSLQPLAFRASPE